MIGMKTTNTTARRRLPLIIGASAAVIMLGGLGYLVMAMLAAPPSPPRIQQITLLPPPPLPPPKIEEPPPEEIQEIDVPEPEEIPEPEQAENDEPPPGEDLGVDAEGAGGGDSFGLVGKKGGRSLIGGGGSRFGGFARALQQELQSYFAEHEDLRTSSYSVIVKLWIAGDGRIERGELVDSTGKHDLDQLLRLALDGLPRLQTPPEDVPQPIRIRITSRS